MKPLSQYYLRYTCVFFLVILCCGLCTDTVYGANSEVAEIEWFTLFMGLFGGLALFLAGLDMLSEGLKKAAGETLKTLLSKMTTNRLFGAATGAFVTAVLNSSSVTTVLVVSFITAGVMTLAQSVGVIMGANIGSTMTAQLLAFNLSSYSLLPISIGFFMTFIAKRDPMKYAGMMLMGLGLVFFGMGIMSEAMTPLRTYGPFMEFLERMERPFLGILAGAIFTGLVQSSAATVGIAIAMATEGLLSLPAGIALALGANIGTCVTALLAALGKPVEAVRAAIVHILFNVIGVLIWLPFIDVLADITIAISPVADNLEETVKAAIEVPRQIANANTIFNVINTTLFIGFSSWFALLAERLYPKRKEKTGIIISPKFLDENALEVPSVAFEQVRQEFGRMGEIAASMLKELPKAVIAKDRKHIENIVKLDDKVDILEAAIFTFLSKIRQQSLTEEESVLHQKLMSATVNLETLADIIETEMAELTKAFIHKERKVSEKTLSIFDELYNEVQHAVILAVHAIRDNDQQAALQVIVKKDQISKLSESLLARKSAHLGQQDAVLLETARIEISMVDKLRRAYTLAKRIAKIVLPPEIS
ncbi:Na/Pi cotransporter family protein [Desulfogranum japonicum]|uniref:Na/Pi cotransporter family protein n=1 Tax=Desulfogranum japonicum TaxID=231447 RepID=UPI0004146C92|nr:Na/Pi cotransporter family protein [Desulfogranum japonicum]